MPLLPGKENVGHNISEMEKAGHKPSQAIAASLKEAGESNKYAAGQPPTWEQFMEHCRKQR